MTTLHKSKDNSRQWTKETGGIIYKGKWGTKQDIGEDSKNQPENANFLKLGSKCTFFKTIWLFSDRRSKRQAKKKYKRTN